MPHRPSEREKMKRLRFDLRRRERRLHLLCAKWFLIGLSVGAGAVGALWWYLSRLP